MVTKFDVGDEIYISLRGRIKEYTASECGDCYTIELIDDKLNKAQQGTRVYLDSQVLKDAVKLKKGGDHGYSHNEPMGGFLD